MLVPTKTCIACKKPGFVEVPESGWLLWQQGAYIQDAFPELSADKREQLITGTHGECFDAMFPYEE